MRRRRLLIVEDQILMRAHLEKIVRDLGWDVAGSAGCRAETLTAMAHATTPPDLALMDLRLSGDSDGIALARELREVHDLPSIFVTAYADRETLHRVEQVGALGYLVKPVTSLDIGAALASASGQLDALRRRRDRRLLDRGEVPHVDDGESLPGFRELVGTSAAMRRIFQQIAELSRLDWTVLVEGETGTGKELVARALHDCSRRRDRPFIAVNCGGLTDSLLSSQLFGHRRGAFTGSVCDQVGLIEAADGGTLLLDEIGDMSPSMQRSLLRVLEERRITRVGDVRSRPVDLRLVVASQHDLRQEVRAGRFRADLLFRLRVARIRLPALRERGGDVPLLATWFLRHSNRVVGKAIASISDEAQRILGQYSWPGNVRELRHAVEFAVLACRGLQLQAEDLPQEIREPEDDAETRSPGHSPRLWTPVERKRRTEQRILDALARTGGNRSQAARLAGVSRATLYRRLAKLEGADAPGDRRRLTPPVRTGP